MAKRLELFAAASAVAAGALAGCGTGTEVPTTCPSDYSVDLTPNNSSNGTAKFPHDLSVGAVTDRNGTNLIVADSQHVLPDATREQGTPINNFWTRYPLGKPISFPDGGKTFTLTGTLGKDQSGRNVVKLSVKATCEPSATSTPSSTASRPRTVFARVA